MKPSNFELAFVGGFVITGLIYLLTGYSDVLLFLSQFWYFVNPFHLGVLAFSCLLFVSTVIFYPRWQWCFHLAFNVFKECPTYSCFSVLKKFTPRKNKGDLHVSALWEIHRQDETDKHNSLRIRSASSGTRYSHLELGCHL